LRNSTVEEENIFCKILSGTRKDDAMKTAIITGGSNCIGKATALELGRRGIGVILTYHSNKKGAEEVIRKIEQNNAVRAVGLKLDLGQKPTFENFGMAFTEMSEEYFDQIFNTNFKGPFFLTQQLVSFMEDGGRIVNTSSTSSSGAFPGYSAYGSAKAALSSWTRYLAKELAPRKIRVNAVSPGPTHTNLADGAFDKNPEFDKILGEQVALGRVGYTEDLAKVIVNLLSEDFGWVTAQDLEVSGGHLL
jgi:NAD(P)-dependent dehydrogenase (short-subunit alcohol dehydrogenase family)